MMFNISPKCANCQKDIESNEEVFIKMRYPRIKGVTEIKAYIQNEGEIFCMACMNNESNLQEIE